MVNHRNSLSEKDAELIASKLHEQAHYAKHHKFDGIKEKLKDKKEMLLESQEGSIIYIVRWIISFISDMIQGFKEALTARRVEREDKRR